MREVGEIPNFWPKLTLQEKAEYLIKAKEKSSDEKPLWVNLEYANLLPWAGMGGVIPHRGIFVGINFSPSRTDPENPQSIILDFTRVVSDFDTPYASLPISAVEINRSKEEIWVDCSKAMDAGVGIPFNRFIERGQN